MNFLSFNLSDSLVADLLLLAHEVNNRPWTRFDVSYTEKDTSSHPLNLGRRMFFLKDWEKVKLVDNLVDDIVSQYLLDTARIVPSGINGQPGLPHFLSCLYAEPRARGIQPHTDPRNTDGWLHLRTNFILSPAASGGDVIIGNTMLEVSKGESWAVWASEHMHRATPVTGKLLRIMFSLGFFVEPTYALDVQNNIKQMVTYFPCQLAN